MKALASTGFPSFIPTILGWQSIVETKRILYSIFGTDHVVNQVARAASDGTNRIGVGIKRRNLCIVYSLLFFHFFFLEQTTAGVRLEDFRWSG